MFINKSEAVKNLHRERDPSSDPLFLSELEAVKNFLRERNISFDFFFCGSKYAAYRLKPDGFRVIRLDKDYFVVSSAIYLMIRRYLIAFRKGDGSAETLFHL